MASSSTSTSRPLTSFTCFGSLPPELRVKIWNYSFQPRALEFHPIRTSYADPGDPDAHAERAPWHPYAWGWTKSFLDPITWQSHSANHPALFTCTESREEALRYFCVCYPTARVAAGTARVAAGSEAGSAEGKGQSQSQCQSQPQPQPQLQPQSQQAVEGGAAAAADNDTKLWRPLYLNPETDTIMPLGRVHEAQILDLLRDIKRRDVRGGGRSSRTPKRVALDLTNWTTQMQLGVADQLHTAADNLLHGTARDCPLPFLTPDVLREMDQLTLLRYNDAGGPPEGFWNGECALEGSEHRDPIWMMLFADRRQRRIEQDALVIDGVRLQMMELKFGKSMGGGGGGGDKKVKNLEDMDDEELEGLMDELTLELEEEEKEKEEKKKKKGELEGLMEELTLDEEEKKKKDEGLSDWTQLKSRKRRFSEVAAVEDEKVNKKARQEGGKEEGSSAWTQIAARKRKFSEVMAVDDEMVKKKARQEKGDDQKS